MNIIEKPWGKEEIFVNNDFYVVKRLTMNASCKCSLQYHKQKTETIYVLQGPLFLHHNYNIHDLEVIQCNTGEVFTIFPGTIHRMEAKETNAIYLECSTPQLDDVVRIEDDYSRV